MLEISQQLKDRYFKYLGIPATVLLVVSLFNLSHPRQKVNWQATDLILLLFLSTSLWLGNVNIQYLLRKKLCTIRKVHVRLIARYSLTIFISYIFSLLWLSVWNYYLHADAFEFRTILWLQAIIIVISMQVASVYEIIYLNRERESDIIKIERTEKAKVQAQLDGLKSQIDPHFILIPSIHFLT